MECALKELAALTGHKKCGSGTLQGAVKAQVLALRQQANVQERLEARGRARSSCLSTAAYAALLLLRAASL